MMFVTHIAVSLLVAFFALPPLSLDTPFLVGVYLFAALLPDIDSASSFIGRHVKPIGWLFRHRGMFHSLWVPLLTGLIVWPVSPEFSFAFGLGYLTHLATDMLTHEGVMPFFPLTVRPRGFIRTGSVVEYILLCLCIVLLLWLVV